MPEVSDVEQQYAIVRRVCDDGEALPDQFIYEEQLRFTLCSTDGKMNAMMPKGINMKHSVKWEKRDGGEVIWRRIGKVVFSLVSVEALSRRNSMSSVYSTASSAFLCNSIDAQDIENVRHQIRPELRGLCNLQPPYSSTSSSSMPGIPWSENKQQDKINLAKTREIKSEQVPPSRPAVSSAAQEEKLFEQIKVHCVRNPNLLKRVLSWGNVKSQSEQMTPQDAGAISIGRLWVTASTGLPPSEMDEKLQEAVDDIKGAYQKISTGVWQQPLPQTGEPGLQHRLLKDSSGCWIIQERIIGEDEKEAWKVCAQELADHRWVDLKNDRREIQVKRVEMVTILERMMEDKTAVESADVQRNYVDFLFKSCNQKKLNSKLKKRNLKHNIANLKVKLDKQYALSFAVKVANTADLIAQELAARQGFQRNSS